MCNTSNVGFNTFSILPLSDERLNRILPIVNWEDFVRRRTGGSSSRNAMMVVVRQLNRELDLNRRLRNLRRPTFVQKDRLDRF